MPPKKIGVNSKAQAGRVRNSERKEKELDKANRVSIPIPKVTDAALPRRGDEEQVHIQANLLPVTGNDQSLQIQANETPSDFVHVIEARSDEDASAQMSEAHSLPVARHPDIRLKASFKRPHCSCRGKTSLMRPFPQLLDHEEVIFSWAVQRRRTRPQPQLLSKCRKLTLQWGHTHHRTSSRLHAQPRRSYTKNLKTPPRHAFEHGLTAGAPKQTQRQANMNPMVTQSTRQPTYTVFGYEDYHLQCMKEHYRKKNIGIVIREESELKIMRKENQRKLRAKEKGKENQKGKEKENQSPNLPVSWDDKAIEWKRIHSSTSRGWRKVNKIFVTNNICWPCTLAMDSLSFQRFMYRRHGRA